MELNLAVYLIGALLGILTSLYIYYKQAGAPEFALKYLFRVIPDLLVIASEFWAMIEVANIPQMPITALVVGLFFGWQADLIIKKITDLFPARGS